ncbi:MAG: serine/threonine protein phosphatase [Clostridia bacterium]|nr:metallophosphoesterase [Anaerotignum sp.]NCC15320.1 serine/threonine protein phosphatase [Clostridia bacterium]
MGLFAIADLHFGFSVNKPMSIFGTQWEGHSEKIIENWKREVCAEDTVLVPGDISWAMKEEEAAVDLEIIQGLPGRKIFLEGNHDYWWKSASKLERKYEGMRFLKNDCDTYGNLFICGTRGWLCPNDSRFTAQDKKLYEREQIRLRLSLDSAMRKGAEEILLMLHFPPVNDKQENSAFLEIIQEYPITRVVYGHLHGRNSHDSGIKGEKEGINFYLVSADYLDFCPKKIL